MWIQSLLLGPDPRERLRRPAAPATGALRKHVLIMKNSLI